MDITVAFAFLARLLTFRSRLLLVLYTHVEDWYFSQGCSARTILRLSLQCFTSLPSPGGGSMIISLWIVVGTIVASTSVALLCYKRSEMTLSEIAEKLEKRESAPYEGSWLNRIGIIARASFVSITVIFSFHTPMKD